MKFEAARIHFLGDVFDAYSSLLSKKKIEFFGGPLHTQYFLPTPAPDKKWKVLRRAIYDVNVIKLKWEIIS